MTASTQEVAVVADAEVTFDPEYDGTYVSDWDYDQAHAATKHIENEWNASVENMDVLLFDAFQHRVWIALGYESWDEWRRSINYRRPLSERRALTAKMHRLGMSTRAIGSALNVSHMTAERDIKAVAAQEDATVTDVPVEEQSEKILGVDGREYSRSRKASEIATRRKTHAYMCLMRVEAIEGQAKLIKDTGLELDDTVTPEIATDLVGRIDAAMKDLRALKTALNNRRNEIEN